MRDPKMKNPRIKDPRIENPMIEDPRIKDPRIEDPGIKDPVHGLKFCHMLSTDDLLTYVLSTYMLTSEHTAVFKQNVIY